MKENDEKDLEKKPEKRLTKKQREDLEKERVELEKAKKREEAKKRAKRKKEDAEWEEKMKKKKNDREKENKELREKALRNKIKLWGAFVIVVSAVAVLIFTLSLLLGLSFINSLVIGVVIWLIVVGITLVLAYVETPFMNEDIVECLGAYIGEPLKAGPHFLFPYFGFEKVMFRVYLGEQKLPLYLDNKEGNAGDVEFQDCSASLEAFFFFKVTDSEKTVFDIDDVLGAISEKADHILRAFFGPYTLDDSIAMKSHFRIENVASLLDVSSDSPNTKLTDRELRELYISKEEAERTQFYKTLAEWGIEPKSFSISDIEIPEDIKNQRSRILTAEKDKEVAKIEIETAKHKKLATVINAEAEAEKITLVGKGEANKLKAIMTDVNLEGSQAADYTIQTEKWKAIGKNANVTIIEDSGSRTSEGVKIGVGIGATGKKVETSKGGKS